MADHPATHRDVRSTPRARRRGGRAVAAGLVLVGAVVSACGGPGSASPTASRQPSHAPSQPPLGFRSAPAFLPTTTTPVDRVVTATPSHPQLAVQGIGVEVDLPAGHVLATVTGPKVPPFVSPPPPAVTATFEISLAHAVGTIPLRVRDFTITDQLGRTFHPTLLAHEKRPPATVSPGRTLTFTVTAVMPTGEGRMHWTPTGTSSIVDWDFIVEND